MSDAAQHITLLVPGLCPAGSDAAFLGNLAKTLPALQRLLSRSKPGPHAANSLDAGLGSHFGLPCGGGAALPVAALTSLVDIDEPAAGYLMRADPVHLRADQSTLRLFDSRTFSIMQEEADALVAAFNEFYVDRGWHLTAPSPQRWYIYLQKAPLISTVAPGTIAGQTIDPNLPRGRDAAAWHALMNEVQMLFHQHPVNVRREAGGEPMINSLWFWGEGRLPETVHRHPMQVATDNPLAMGLALFTKTPRRDLPASLDELLTTEQEVQTLLVLDELEAAVQYSDIEAWHKSMIRIERHWFAPLLAALEDGRVASVEIDPCSGKSYRTTRRLLKRFWKRVRPLSALCQHG